MHGRAAVTATLPNWQFLLTQVRSGSEAVRLTAHGHGSAPSLRSKIAETLGLIDWPRGPATATRRRFAAGWSRLHGTARAKAGWPWVPARRSTSR